MVRKLVNMASTADESTNPAILQPAKALYDYGLTLRLNSKSLEKLDLDTSDVSVGDLLHLFAMAEVTSVSKHDSGDGEQCNIELTLTHIGIPENESTEFEAE